MLKFKKIFIILIIYFIVIFSYLFFMRPNDMSIAFFYINMIFIILYLIIANLFIESDNLIELKINRYRNKSCFFKESIKQFTINIFIIFFGISLLNCLMLYMIGSHVDLTLNFYYFIGLFFIIETFYAYILSFSFKKKMNLIRYLALLILLGMFILGKSNMIITSINIFKYILYNGSLYNLFLHYSVWLISAYILIDYNSKRVEL